MAKTKGGNARKKARPKNTSSARGIFPTPTGPHTAISNNAPESGTTAATLKSLPQTGTEAGILEPRNNGTEALRSEIVVESAQEITAPDTSGLADIGAASFADPQVTLEAVHGQDNRIRVNDTDKYPYRVNASLLITARDGSQWLGTGWFISARTLVTAAHCVYIKGSGSPSRDGWVRSIQVLPGRNVEKLPYGSTTSTYFWTVKGWAETGNENYDYAAIIIPTDLGTKVGTMGFAVYNDADLVGQVANVTGYPGDKGGGGEMWYDTKEVAAVTPTKVHYDIDTAGGQSGACVYVVKGTERMAIAVHAYGGATTNSGSRISALVFANLTNWKR
jgi:glutamyl endopeptidase